MNGNGINSMSHKIWAQCWCAMLFCGVIMNSLWIHVLYFSYFSQFSWLDWGNCIIEVILKSIAKTDRYLNTTKHNKSQTTCPCLGVILYIKISVCSHITCLFLWIVVIVLMTVYSQCNSVVCVFSVVIHTWPAATPLAAPSMMAMSMNNQIRPDVPWKIFRSLVYWHIISEWH